MISSRLVALALLLLLAAIGRDAHAEEARSGRVVMSDGTVLSGRLVFTVGQRLHLTDPATGRGRDVEPQDLAAILFRVESESLERPYTFTTPGKDEKTYGEGHYPLRELLCTLVWKTGERQEGHLKTTLVRVVGPEREGAEDPDERRVLLRRQWKGSVGQTLDDLVFAREVRFADAVGPVERSAATLDVVLKGVETARAGAAYGVASRLVYAGSVVEGPACHIRFEGLPADVYDVAVLSGSRALVGSARAARTVGPARPIVDAEDGVGLAAIVSTADDLYDQRTLVATGGDRDGARLVVWKRVLRATTFDADRGRSQALVAIDVWSAHRLEREWRIDGRANLLRVVLKPGEEPPTAVVVPRLAGVLVAAGERAQRTVERLESVAAADGKRPEEGVK